MNWSQKLGKYKKTILLWGRRAWEENNNTQVL